MRFFLPVVIPPMVVNYEQSIQTSKDWFDLMKDKLIPPNSPNKHEVDLLWHIESTDILNRTFEFLSFYARYFEEMEQLVRPIDNVKLGKLHVSCRDEWMHSLLYNVLSKYAQFDGIEIANVLD